MIAERLLHLRRPWLFALLASLLIFGLQYHGAVLRPLLQFDRQAMEAGEWYRLLSGHWVHLDWMHACMNVAGLWLLVAVDTENPGSRAYVLRSVVLSSIVGLMLYRGVPALQWYVGLSGVLHGLFVIVLLRSACLQRDRLTLLILAILIGKLIWEHYHGALTQAALAAPVIVSAHSYGALTGAVYAAASSLASWHIARRPVTRSTNAPNNQSRE